MKCRLSKPAVNFSSLSVQLQYFVEMDHMYCANCGVTEAKQVASVGTAFVLFVLVFLKKVFYSIEIVFCDLS